MSFPSLPWFYFALLTSTRRPTGIVSLDFYAATTCPAVTAVTGRQVFTQSGEFDDWRLDRLSRRWIPARQM